MEEKENNEFINTISEMTKKLTIRINLFLIFPPTIEGCKYSNEVLFNIDPVSFPMIFLDHAQRQQTDSQLRLNKSSHSLLYTNGEILASGADS